jgi:hypothetical protein
VRRAVSTFVNHRHDAETYDDREGATLGRIHIERSFQGDLEGEATAELLTATAENGAAVYLALDRISGRLDGREGSFVLQHRGVLPRREPKSTVRSFRAQARVSSRGSPAKVQSRSTTMAPIA